MAARWLKPRAMGDEARLRGLNEPATAGFVNAEPGTSVPRRAQERRVTTLSKP